MQRHHLVGSGRRGARRGAAVVLTGVVGLLAACGGGTGGSDGAEDDPLPAEVIRDMAEDAERQGNTATYEVLRDGDVTRAEYEDAAQRWADCVGDRGLVPADPVVNRGDGITLILAANYDALGDEAGTDADFACRDELFTPVENAYRLVTPARMDEALRQASIACFQEEGLEVGGDAGNYEEMVRAAGAEGTDDEALATREVLRNCISEAHQDLYPAEILALGY